MSDSGFIRKSYHRPLHKIKSFYKEYGIPQRPGDNQYVKEFKPFEDLNADEIFRCTRTLFNSRKSNAKRRGKSWNLTLEQFYELVHDNCYYCGSEPLNSFKYYGMEIKYNGIDRMENSIGYEPDNCVSCCIFCNSLKQTMKFDDWADFINGVAVTHGGKAPFPEVWERLEQEPDVRPTKSFYPFSGV